MKTYIKITIVSLTIIASVLLVSCKPKEMSASTLAKIERITATVEAGKYKFVPRSANPTGYGTINLDPTYFLKVSNDTLQVYLPYFGRSYTAPIDVTKIGFDFTSTDFNYSISSKKDTWDISIKPNDVRNKQIQIYMTIGNTGYTSVRIQDSDRQGISYYGEIEIEME